MHNVDLLRKWFWTLLTVTLVITWCPSQVGADFNTITPSDIAYSEPFEITAKIMAIDYSENMLIVAENEIYVVDLTIGAETIKTDLSDAYGEAISFKSLGRGQTVMVSGMKIPDGRVIAEELVRLRRDPPAGDLHRRGAARPVPHPEPVQARPPGGHRGRSLCGPAGYPLSRCPGSSALRRQLMTLCGRGCWCRQEREGPYPGS